VWAPWSTAAALVAVGAFHWRRRAPVPALLVAVAAQLVVELAAARSDVVARPSLGHVAVIGLLALAVARRAERGGQLVAAGTLVGAGLLGEAVAVAPDWERQLTDALVVAALAATGAALRYRAASAEATAARIRADERERIGRDLHDVVAHHVSAIAVQAEGARLAAATDPHAAVRSLEQIRATASGALDEMRRLVTTLRAGDAPAGTGVGRLAELVVDHGGPPVTLHRSGPVDALPAAVDGAVVRIAQEAVTNARRHARGATGVVVRVDAGPDRVVLTVTDDGAPGSSRRPGYGLIGMSERCAALGGRLDAGPAAGGGWCVRAELPLGAPR
jgi:signal transduction histidine kinase